MTSLREALGEWEVTPKKSEAPLRPVSRWITASGGSLFKRFSFLSNAERNRFVSEVLEHELDTGHCATMKVSDREVMIALITGNIGVHTELDREYADVADTIYADIVRSATA